MCRAVATSAAASRKILGLPEHAEESEQVRARSNVSSIGSCKGAFQDLFLSSALDICTFF